jgi:hypothetical protein
MDKKQF